jgi:hypothetical protein
MLRQPSALHVFICSIVLLVFPIRTHPESPQLAQISGVVGAWLAIAGTNFGETQGASTVDFDATVTGGFLTAGNLNTARIVKIARVLSRSHALIAG